MNDFFPGRRKAIWIGLAACLAAGPSAAATVIVGGGTMVEGSGRTVDDERRVPSFSRVVVDGPMDVQLTRAASERAVVHADDNIVPLIETRVEDGKLLVQVRKDASFRTRSKIAVMVDFKQIDAVQLRGSGDVVVDDIKGTIFEGVMQGSGNLRVDRLEAGTVAISIAGSGDFDAGGRADKIGIVIRGSGNVRAEDLEAKAAAVRISGSGDVSVHATETLQAHIAGSGDVRYRGSPQVEKKVAGSGDVRPMR